MSASNILVVDTDPGTAELVSALFPSDVCTVQTAADAAEAMEMARNNQPVLAMICADIESGYGCCRQFKKDAELQELPLVLVSAHATPEQFKDHQKLPTSADAYLHKPLDESLLASVVIDLLGTSRKKPIEPKPQPEHAKEDDAEIKNEESEVPSEKGEDSNTETLLAEDSTTTDSLDDKVVADPEMPEEHDHDPEPAPTSMTPRAEQEHAHSMPTSTLVQLDALTHERDALLSQNADLKQANQRSQQFFEIEQQRLLSQIATLKARYEALEEKLRQNSVNELTDKIEAQQDQIVSLRAEIQQLKSVRRNLEYTLTDALATVAKLPQD